MNRKLTPVWPLVQGSIGGSHLLAAAGLALVLAAACGPPPAQPAAPPPAKPVQEPKAPAKVAEQGLASRGKSVLS